MKATACVYDLNSLHDWDEAALLQAVKNAGAVPVCKNGDEVGTASNFRVEGRRVLCDLDVPVQALEPRLVLAAFGGEVVKAYKVSLS